MDKERLSYICTQTEQGRDTFVRHPETGEEGRVLSCAGEQIEVENTAGEKRIWDYRETEQITRSKEEWPRRD
ncbi:MAG TPA: hypothetical protein VKN62_06575 [Pelovirga sp.]|nr:hypothetical protein [Pelovirga sp.]